MEPRPRWQQAFSPLSKATAPRDVDHAPKREKATGRQPRRAFLLEDNLGNGLVIDGLLELLGYDEVTWVGCLSDARAEFPALAAGAYDLVLLDLMLPDGESFELLADLKAAGVGRVCMYTARTATEDRARMWNAGCDHIFEKPISVSGFVAAHDRLFGGNGG